MVQAAWAALEVDSPSANLVGSSCCNQHRVDLMKALFITVLSLFAITLAKPAQASHHKHHHYSHKHYAHRHYRHYARHHRQHNDVVSAHVASNEGRPADCYGIPWCGCALRHWLGIADTALNLAANWAHWGRPTEPHVGAVVVWRHHVGKIVGGSPGHWAVLSGNDGHRVRTRVRSVSGAIAFREG